MPTQSSINIKERNALLKQRMTYTATPDPRVVKRKPAEAKVKKPRKPKAQPEKKESKEQAIITFTVPKSARRKNGKRIGKVDMNDPQSIRRRNKILNERMRYPATNRPTELTHLKDGTKIRVTTLRVDGKVINVRMPATTHLALYKDAERSVPEEEYIPPVQEKPKKPRKKLSAWRGKDRPITRRHYNYIKMLNERHEKCKKRVRLTLPEPKDALTQLMVDTEKFLTERRAFFYEHNKMADLKYGNYQLLVNSPVSEMLQTIGIVTATQLGRSYERYRGKIIWFRMLWLMYTCTKITGMCPGQLPKPKDLFRETEMTIPEVARWAARDYYHLRRWLRADIDAVQGKDSYRTDPDIKHTGDFRRDQVEKVTNHPHTVRELVDRYEGLTYVIGAYSQYGNIPSFDALRKWDLNYEQTRTVHNVIPLLSDSLTYSLVKDGHMRQALLKAIYKHKHPGEGLRWKGGPNVPIGHCMSTPEVDNELMYLVGLTYSDLEYAARHYCRTHRAALEAMREWRTDWELSTELEFPRPLGKWITDPNIDYGSTSCYE